MNSSNTIKFPRLNLPLLLVLLFITVVGCTDLGGEPEVVATLPPITVTPENTDLGYPSSHPDLQQGAAIYAARCIACHGEDGRGNGELVLAGEVENPGDFTVAEAVEGQGPDDYFNIITNGNLERLMPPWRNELSEEERWAVALYTYSLHYTAEQISEGEEIYFAECAECHGQTGAGDGPELVESAREVNDLSNPQNAIFLSDSNIQNIVIEGAGVNMPAYADTLSPEQIAAVTSYVRTLSLENVTIAQQPAIEETPETTPEPISSIPGSITGSVSNGSESGDVPADLTIVLHIFDGDLTETTIEIPLAQDLTFAFEDVPIRSDFFYFISVEHSGRDFASNPFALEPESPEIDIPLLIYDLTDDASNITIAQIITQITPAGQVLQFDQEITLRNNSDRVFITDQLVTEGRQASLKFQLPVGSVLVPQQSNLFYDENTFTVFDTRAVLPDTDYVVTMTYLVPYSGSAIIDYPLDYRLDGLVVVLIDSDEITVQSDQLEFVDPTAVPNLENTAYGSALTLNPGEVISFELNGGAPQTTETADADVVSTDSAIPILIGAAIIIIGGLGAVIYFSRQRFDDPNGRAIDVITQELTALETAHDRGEINHDLYQRQKAELKTQLQNLINSTSTPDQDGQNQDD